VEVWDFILNIVVVLSASLVLGGVFSRLGQSPLVGYLVAGMFIGGRGSLELVQPDEISGIAELGVALLLFSLGLEFSWNRLRSLGRSVIVGGVLQIVLTAAVAAGLGSVFGLPWREALVVGAMVSLSSTATVLRLLREKRQLDSVHGRTSLGILLVQDMAIVPLALFVSLLGTPGSFSSALLDLGKLVGVAVALTAGLYFISVKLLIPVFGGLAHQRNRELGIILATACGLAAAWGAHAVGMSPAIGAFLAGMFLGASPFSAQIRADIRPLQAVLLTLFFCVAGMVVEPLWLIENCSLVLPVVVLLLVGKLLIAWGALRLARVSLRASFISALSVAQVGEFAFVLGEIGRSQGVLSEEVQLLILSASFVTLLLTPFMIPLALKIATRLTDESWSEGLNSEIEEAGERVIVVGFGPAGQLAVASLCGAETQVVVVDLNRSVLEAAAELGFEAVVGDATQNDILEEAGIERASTIVITVPDSNFVVSLLAQVRALNSDARVVVRSRYQCDEELLRGAGAEILRGDETEVGKALAVVLSGTDEVLEESA